jgi:hypothetical protein
MNSDITDIHHIFTQQKFELRYGIICAYDLLEIYNERC